MADKQISDLTSASSLTDGSLFVLEQGGAAKKANWGMMKNYLSPGIAPQYSTSSTYAVGDYVIHNDQLYRCITAITTAEAWTAAHWTAAVLGNDVGELKSAISPLYVYENYATGTGRGSATTQTATFSTALQANKKYRIDVEIDPSKTTAGSVYLSSGGTLTLIGEIASGSTEASFDVNPSSVCEAIRFNSAVNTETYSVMVKVQTPTYASKDELSALSSEVAELQGQVVDLGYDADNIKQITETDTVSTTLTAGYVGRDGTVHESTSYYYTTTIPVSEGDIISGETSDMFRFLCAKDANNQPDVDKGMGSGFSTYTVPSGITGVILSIYSNKVSYAVLHTKTYTKYVAPQKPFGIFKAEGNLNDSEQLSLPIVNVNKNIIQTFSADITSFSKVQVGVIKDSEYAYLEIDDTNITIKIDSAADTVIPHGLTIANNINVRIIQNTDGKENPTKLYRGYIELSSNGSMFKTDDMNLMPQNYWTRTYCRPFAKSVGSNLTNCVMSYIPSDAKKDIYMFGDSYFSFYAERWTYYLVQNGFDKNILMNAYAGENSANAVKALDNLLKLGITPTYAVWCLGMNDGADSASDPSTAWADGRDTFINQCKKYGVIPVFGTIPSVPNKNNEKKNEWIRNSGYQYIDFAKAVGAQSDGTWYSGMLSQDNVHPTAAGGIALYGRVLTDFPQIAYSD